VRGPGPPVFATRRAVEGALRAKNIRIADFFDLGGIELGVMIGWAKTL
jgi:hypothetical protein